MICFTQTVGTAEAPLTRLLDDATYVRRLEHWTEHLDVSALLASSKPPAGLEIIAVGKDSPAERAGMRIGDILTAINGHSLRFVPDFMAACGQAGGPMDLWSLATGKYSIVRPPLSQGPMGFSFDGPTWYPALGYVRSPDRSPRWDNDMLAACVAYREDPDFAVTALAHARAAGYHGSYGAALRLCAEHNRGHHDEALAGGGAAVDGLPAVERGEAAMDLYSAALRSYRLPLAQSLVERMPDLHADTHGFAAYLDDHKTAQAGRRDWSPSLPRPPGEQRYDLAGMLKCIGSDHSDVTTMALKAINRTEDLDIKPLRGQSNWVRLDIPAVDVTDFSLDFSLNRTDEAAIQESFILHIGPQPSMPSLMRTQCSSPYPSLVSIPAFSWSRDFRGPRHLSL